MSRKTNPGIPALEVVYEVIRLDDALVAAERRSNSTECLPEPWLPERAALFDFLSRQPDIRMTELHECYWLGRRLTGTAQNYEDLYQQALTNLDHGVSYLMGKNLGDGLRRGLAKLGLPVPTRFAVVLAVTRPEN
jgi:hypothetical protein